jgi:hypothetical protein
MIVLAFAATFFGFALGLRYKILVPIFAMLFIGTGVVISALASQSTFLNLIQTLVLTFTCLQLGFIGGAAGRHRKRFFGHSGGWHTTSLNWPAKQLQNR